MTAFRLAREYSLIPGAVGLSVAFRIITPGLLAKPSLLQQFPPQLAYRRVLVDLDIAEKTEALTGWARGAEFAGGQGHWK
jgi:phosphoribosylformimino-5-aminoimidazole carboxamide ribonucleotide (ProFAR) isomerase